MNKTKKAIIAVGLLGAMLSAPVTFAQSIDQERVQRMFGTPDAKEIVQAHNQRIANIESEIDQVTTLINKYARFENRMDSLSMSPALKRDMKRVMSEEIDRYWQIHKKLTEIRQLLEARPSFNIKAE
jgi:hypothetical protein